MTGDWFTIGTTILSVWVLGEAVVLTVMPGIGIRLKHAWTSPENLFTLFSDYLLGGWLLYSHFVPVEKLGVCLLLGALGLTHLFRCTQAILGLPRPFCTNKVLMLMNIARLSIALFLWGVCVAGH